MGDAHAPYAKRLCDSHGVHFAGEIDAEVPFAVVEALQHLDPSKAAIVEQDGGDGQAQAGDGRKLRARHAEGAIAHQADDAFMWPGEGCTDRRG